MERYIKFSRLLAMALVFAILIGIYAITLHRIQTVEAAELANDKVDSVATDYIVRAARGSVLDRNGVLLSSDRTVYDVLISRTQLLQQEDPNAVLTKLIDAAEDAGVEYNDSFPVTTTAPFEYKANTTNNQDYLLKEYFKYFKNSLKVEDLDDPQVDVTDLMRWLREHYKIDYTVPAEEARKLIGVRWELEVHAIVPSTDYYFAQDVPAEFITYISEQHLPSVSVETRAVREYHTEYAAHLLGYVAAMDPDEYNDKYRDLGYPLNATVGKTGVEAAFEEYLHGVDGSNTVYTDASGAVTDVVENKKAVAGSNVYLTIDIALQQVAESSLASTIEQMNQERIEQAQEEAAENNTTVEEPELAEGGAVTVIDVRTGEVLALASYPTYDLSTYRQNAAALNNDPTSPLVNRATTGLYEPGSTFKMVTAFAALSNHFIAPSDTIYDDIVYTAYAEQHYTPRCWSTRSHGDINVVGALENSCNYFFFTVADRMGINRIAEAARLFGLDSRTGIEVYDKPGQVASRELKREKLHEGWYSADTLLACIGQGLNRFTPIELACYVSTIANNGTRYAATLLRHVTSFDYSEVLMRKSPRVVAQINDPGGYIPVLQQGMRAVATTGTARNALANYPVAVAAKTGTVQSDNSAMNDGVFVCYAPADNPQIAISVVVEKGGSGSALITIAKDIMNAYFSDSVAASYTVPGDNTLVK